MEEIQIQYGGRPLQLKKSEQLVGLRAVSGRAQEIARVSQAERAEPLPERLAAFQLVRMSATPSEADAALDRMRNDPDVQVGTHVYHTSDDGVPFVPTGQIYVEFDEKAKPKDCEKLLDKYALEIAEVHNGGAMTLRVTPQSPNPVTTASELQKESFVKVAEPDLATPAKLTAFTLPGDDLLGRQWHLRNTGEIDGSTIGLKAGADARVVAAWELAQTLGATGVTVAVIDDGFDLGHPDLSGAGKVVAPWDFTRNSSDPSPNYTPTYPYYNPGTGEWVGDWHGTACAGVAIGQANGGGIVGAAPDCRFMPVRWGPNLSNSQVTAWFKYVRDQGAAVVSCSWSAAARNFPLSTLIKNAIADCATAGRGGKGCVIVFAAGNENRDVNDPSVNSVNGFAIHPDVIAVAACTSRDQRSSYSNFGDAISVCAPSSGAGGRGIVTADVTGTFNRSGVTVESGYSPGAFTTSFGGTSSATPLVAGICALLLSIDSTLTAAEVKHVLESTARKIGPASSYGTNGHSREFGFGCVNAEAAVAEVQNGTGSPTPTKKRPVKAASRRKAVVR